MVGFKQCLVNTWFSLLLLTLICLGVSRVFHKEPRMVRRDVLGDRKLQNAPTELSKTVTRSLSQSENKIDLTDNYVLFYNRVPKSGSEMLVLLLQWLQGVNGFRHVHLPLYHKRKLSRIEQERLVLEVSSISQKESVPTSFDRHVYFTNFTEFGKQQPIFMNLVRDPVDKAVSRFYYARVTPNPLNPDIKFSRSTTSRKPNLSKFGDFETCVEHNGPDCAYYSGKPYDMTIPYFCGHYRQCMILNDRWALARAKKNVEMFFPVVGVLEELNATLTVLENTLPPFFKGVTNMYYHELLEPHKNANRLRPRTVDTEVRNHVKEQLTTEYEFYYWLKARLLRQYASIT